MVRFIIVGAVVAVAFSLYALVDAAMAPSTRARGVNKPVWIVLIVLLPVIGGILWFTIGKGQASQVRPSAPDDDPRFTGNRMSNADLDAHMRDLEEQLRALDEETYPGEKPGSSTEPEAPGETDTPNDAGGSGDNGTRPE